jgi:two-component system LytT family response regulator
LPEPGRQYRAVIADDEPAAREVLSGFLDDVSMISVIGEARNGKEAVEVVRRLSPDLLFLDVQMPDRDGFGVLDALGDDVPRGVIFVTAHDEHALRAFEVHALDYILKPFGRPRFDAAVARAVRRLEADDAWSLRRTLAAMVAERRTPAVAATLAGASDSAGTSGHARRFAVRRNERTVLVNVDDVDWIEADGDYVRLHTGAIVHLLATRMHSVESRLDPQRFHRIHRSTIVRLQRVRELRRSDDGGGVVVLENGVQLRVARNRWATLEAALSLE